MNSKWKKLGLYVLIALGLYMVIMRNAPPRFDFRHDPVGALAGLFGGLSIPFLLVAIVGESFVAIRRRTRRSKSD